MCAGIDDGVLVDVHEDDVVAAVVQLVDDCLHVLAELSSAFVSARAEEDEVVAWDAMQMHRLAAFEAELREVVQSLGQGSVVGVVDDDFLAVELSAGSQSEQPHEEVAVALDVEDDAVRVGLVSEEDASCRQHDGAEPCAALHGPDIGLGIVLACLVDDVVEDEDDDADNDRHSESAFADDGSQWCSDEEEEQACQAHGELLVPLDAMLAQAQVSVARLECAELALSLHRLGFGQSCSPRPEALVVGHCHVDGVEGRHLLCLLDDGERVGAPSRNGLAHVPQLDVVVDGMAGAVYHVAHRVDAVVYLSHVLRLSIVCEEVGIHQVEVGIEGNHVNLLDERFAHVWDVSPEHGALLGIHVAEAFAAPERQFQVHLVGCALHASAVGQHYLYVVVASRVGVDHHAVEHARLGVFVLHEEVVAWYLAVEDAFGDFQLGTLLPHAPCQSRQLARGVGAHLVLEVEAAAADDGRHQDEGCEDAYEGDAGCLHAEQLEALAQVAERDKAGQQDCQGHRHGDERQTAVPEELAEQVDGESLADEVVHPLPQELHDEDEKADEEGACKELQESLDDVDVELLDNLHCHSLVVLLQPSWACALLVRKDTTFFPNGNAKPC